MQTQPTQPQTPDALPPALPAHAAEGSGPHHAVRDARLLSGTLQVVILLLVVMILLVVQRWVRRRIDRKAEMAAAEAPTRPPVDPWFEAGRRAKPIEPNEEPPSGGSRRGRPRPRA